MELIWKDYIYNGLLYRVSEKGEVVGPRGRKLKQRLNEDGYLCVTLGKNECGRVSVKTHRIVATLFVENDNPDVKTEVNHKDCNRTNCCADNLEWVSHRDNVMYSYLRGRYTTPLKQRENNGRSRLTSRDVQKIRKMIALGYSNLEIARLFDVGASTIWNIKMGNTWKGV